VRTLPPDHTEDCSTMGDGSANEDVVRRFCAAFVRCDDDQIRATLDAFVPGSPTVEFEIGPGETTSTCRCSSGPSVVSR
jgi:hypothetical protein